jgi:hypothetical protein
MSATVAEPRAALHPISVWPQYPSTYEVNTWVWLSDLSQTYGIAVDLFSVPFAEWDAIAALGFDAVWLMGVWERSPAGIAIANQNKGLVADFRRALPDFRPEDNVGSPYCVRRYVVDERLGGPEGLAVARRELSKRGLNLVLDFVPNHVAPDHPWTEEHPEYFVAGTDGGRFAAGRDPYFPPWDDTRQLDAFSVPLRRAAATTVLEIADQCDGVRCDMAMLLLNRVFAQTWGDRVGWAPPGEYWTDVISPVRDAHPGFIFMAEAYWDLESELQGLGFDFCYDKRLYDRLEHDNAESVRLHLSAGLDYQDKLVRFIENHDEPRAAGTFSSGKRRSVAVAFLTLMGAKLLHEGQLEGRKVRLPVFLGRRPSEPVDHDLLAFYGRLLNGINRTAFRNGAWRLCERSGWPDNQSCQNLLAWCWDGDEERYLIIINFRQKGAQARVHVPWDELRGKDWQLKDVLSGESYERTGSEMRDAGLFVDLGPWKCHLFQVSAL